MKISLLFIFFRLPSSSSSSLFFSIKCNSKTIRFVKILSLPNSWSFTVHYSLWFSATCKLRVASYGLETVANTLCFSFVGFLALNVIIVWVWHVRLGHTLTSWAEPDLRGKREDGLQAYTQFCPCCKIFAVQSDCSISRVTLIPTL